MAIISLIVMVLFAGYGEEGVDTFYFEPIIVLSNNYIQGLVIFLALGLTILFAWLANKR